MSVADCDPGTPVTTGAAGTAAGVTVIVSLYAEEPRTFVAFTETVYSVPLTKPFRSVGLIFAFACLVTPPAVYNIVYPVF